MLVLSRNEGQDIVVGNPARPDGIIRVEVARKGKARLSFDFPKGVPIHRREVADDIAAEGGEQTYRNSG